MRDYAIDSDPSDAMRETDQEQQTHLLRQNIKMPQVHAHDSCFVCMTGAD